MTILDRYILKSFFFNLILWCFCIIGIYIIFDLFTNLDALLREGKAVNNIPKVIFQYYLFKSVPIAMMLTSLLGLLSAMITVSMMMRQNELVPIQAAGISTVRIIAPLIGAVVFVAVGATILREAVLPNYLDELVMDVQDFSNPRGTIVNATIDNATGVTIQGARIFRKELRISQPKFVLNKPVVKNIVYLNAQDAFHFSTYQQARKNRPAGFMLIGVRENLEVLEGPTITYKDNPILITHQDAPDWIEPGNCFVVSNVPFDYLASNDAWRQYASTFDLVQAARNKSLDVGKQIHAIIHSRLLQPVLDVTLLFLGLPVILTCGRNIFKGLGVSGLIVLAFLVVQKSCQFLGASSDMPVLGAWLPMMIFLPIAVNQFMMLREK